MNEIVFSDQLADIAQSLEAYPVDFDQAWQWVGYSTKQKALEALRENFEEGTDFHSLALTNQRNKLNLKVEFTESETQPRAEKLKHRGGRGKSDKYYLTADCFKAFCMMASTSIGKQVRRYYIELEKRFIGLRSDLRLSKAMRRELTDVIQESGLNEAMHGFAYKTFTDLIYKAVLGMDARHYRETHNLPKDANVRDFCTTEQKTVIARMEKVAGSMIELGADYRKVKLAIEDFGIPKMVAAQTQGAVSA